MNVGGGSRRLVRCDASALPEPRADKRARLDSRQDSIKQRCSGAAAARRLPLRNPSVGYERKKNLRSETYDVRDFCTYPAANPNASNYGRGNTWLQERHSLLDRDSLAAKDTITSTDKSYRVDDRLQARHLIKKSWYGMEPKRSKRPSLTDNKAKIRRKSHGEGSSGCGRLVQRSVSWTRTTKKDSLLS